MLNILRATSVKPTNLNAYKIVADNDLTWSPLLIASLLVYNYAKDNIYQNVIIYNNNYNRKQAP